MRAEKKPCPCGCRKFMVPPIIGCQCGTLSKAEADELVRRWNAFEEPPNVPVTVPRHDSSDKTNADGLRQWAQLVEHDRMAVVSSQVEMMRDRTVVTLVVVMESERRLLG